MNRDTDSSVTPKRVPASLIQRNRRKMTGAARRMERCTNRIESLGAELEKKNHVLNGAQKKLIRGQMLSLEHERELAKDAYRKCAEKLRDAATTNNRIQREDLQDYRAERRLNTQVPRFVDKIESQLFDETQAGVISDEVMANLRSFVTTGDFKAFDKALGEVVQGSQPDLWETITRFASVERQVVKRLWAKYQSMLHAGDEVQR